MKTIYTNKSNLQQVQFLEMYISPCNFNSYQWENQKTSELKRSFSARNDSQLTVRQTILKVY